MTQCFSSYRCFDKGKVTYYHATVEHNMHHWLKFQVELYGPTQVIHERRTCHPSLSERPDFFLQLSSVLTSGNGFQHLKTLIVHDMSASTILPLPNARKIYCSLPLWSLNICSGKQHICGMPFFIQHVWYPICTDLALLYLFSGNAKLAADILTSHTIAMHTIP
jgi:hypothetical protein